MAVYILLLIGTVLAGIPLCSEKCGKWGRMVYCIALALVFIVISAVRFQVGYDYNLYGGTYFNMKYMDIEDIASLRMEKGFLIPLYVLNLAFEDYRTVFVYTSLIIYPSVFYLIYKNSSCPWISASAYLCFGLFFNSLCFLRQVMAALIVAYAIKFVCEKRPIKFWVLVIAASAFHWSALVALIMYPLLRIKPGYIYTAIATAGTVIFCIFSKAFMFWAIDNFYMYKGYNPETNVEAMNGLPVRYTVIFGVLFLVCFVFRKRLAERNPNNSVYINCLMYTVIFEAMGTRHGILSRFALITYIPPILYLIPDLVYTIKEYISERFSGGLKKQAVYICAGLAAALFSAGSYAMLMMSNYNGTVPYVSQFNRPKDIFVEVIYNESDDEEDWDDEDLEDEEWDDEEWEDEDRDEKELENDILNQLS